MRPLDPSTLALVLALATAVAPPARAEVPDEVARDLDEGAVPAAGRAIKRLASSRPEALAWSAWVWLQASKPSRARDLAQKARGEGYPGPLPDLVEGRARLQLGEPEVAFAMGRAAEAGGAPVRGALLAGEARLRVGRRDEAREAFNRAIDAFNRAGSKSREARLAAARAGALNKDPYGALKLLGALEADYPWMARVRLEAGELFLRHYQTGDAAAEFQAGLKIRPGSALMLSSVALARYHEHRIDEALKLAERALSIDDRQPRAWLVKARCELRLERWGEARAAADKAASLRPDDPEYLALRAEVLAAQGAGPEADAAKRACLAINPHYAELDAALGYSAQRQYRQEAALQHFREGLARDPTSVSSLFGRGSLQLHQGRLEAAREDLERARFLDPFLVPAVNYLKVLDRLDAFVAHPVPRGYLVLSPRGPEAAAPVLADKVGHLIDDLAATLDHRLRHQQRIEVFSDVRWFNARVRGVEGEAMRGVCFGRCSSFASYPAETRSFGWLRIMRHELVHMFNLDRVGDGYMPRWITEGLATHLEPPRDESWWGMLAGAVRAREVIPLERLSLSFQRSDLTSLAYMHSGVAMGWFLETFGVGTLNDLLDLYARRVPAMEALEQATGWTRARLEAGYRQRVLQEAAQFHGDPVYRRFPTRLKKAADAGDSQAALELARALLIRGNPALAEKALAGALGAPGRDEVGARIAHARKAPDAPARLEAVVAAGAASYGLLLDAAQARQAAGDVDGALELLRRAHLVHPAGRAGAGRLYRLLEVRGEHAEAERVLEAALKHEADDAWSAAELSRRARQRGDHARARRFLVAALEVDATRPDFFLELARLEVEAKDRAAARRAYAIFAGLSRTGLAWPDVAPPPPQRTPPQARSAAGPGRAPASPPPRSAGDEADLPWLEPVSPGARRREVAWLSSTLSAEPDAEVALAGLADALGRELAVAMPGAEASAYPALREALHGAWGLRAAHAAAVGLGMDRRREAAGFLFAALGVDEEGPFGQGRLADHAVRALEALAVRDRKFLEPWWGEAWSKSSSEWLADSLRARGYPPPPEGPDGLENLLVIALEDDHWYRSYGARHALGKRLGLQAGLGGFLPGRHQSRLFEPVRTHAAGAYRRALKERHLARTGRAGS